MSRNNKNKQVKEEDVASEMPTQDLSTNRPSTDDSLSLSVLEPRDVRRGGDAPREGALSVAAAARFVVVTHSREGGSVRGEPSVRAAWPERSGERFSEKTARPTDSVYEHPERLDAVAWSEDSVCEQTDRAVGATWSALGDASFVTAASVAPAVRTRAQRRCSEEAADASRERATGWEESRGGDSLKAGVGIARHAIRSWMNTSGDVAKSRISKNWSAAAGSAPCDVHAWERCLTPSWRVYLAVTRQRANSAGMVAERPRVPVGVSQSATAVKTKKGNDDDDGSDDDTKDAQLGSKRAADGSPKSSTAIEARLDQLEGLVRKLVGQSTNRAGDSRVRAPSAQAVALEATDNRARQAAQEELAARIKVLDSEIRASQGALNAALGVAVEKAMATAHVNATYKSSSVVAQQMLTEGRILRGEFEALVSNVRHSHTGNPTYIALGLVSTAVGAETQAAAATVRKRLDEAIDAVKASGSQDAVDGDAAMAILSSVIGAAPQTLAERRVNAEASFEWVGETSVRLMYDAALTHLTGMQDSEAEVYGMMIKSLERFPPDHLLRIIALLNPSYVDQDKTSLVIELLQKTRLTVKSTATARVAAVSTPSNKASVGSARVSAVSTSAVSRYTPDQTAQYNADRAKRACFFCHKVGHEKRDCPVRGGRAMSSTNSPNTRRARVGEEEEVTPPEISGAREQSIEDCASSVVLILNGERQLIVAIDVVTAERPAVPIQALIDTGAAPSMMNMKTIVIL